MATTNIQTFSGDVEVVGGLTVTGTLASTTGVDKVTLAVDGTNTARPIIFSTGTTGSQALKTDPGITYNPSTNKLTVSGGLSQSVSPGSYLTGTAYDGSTARTFAVDATSANTASKVVARDASGNFSAGTITAALSTSLSPGTYLTGTAYNGSTARTFAVDATSANTASKVVARDASGNFSAGTITAALSGNATTATTLQTARTIGGVSFDGSANINLPGVNTAGNQNTSGNAATATTLATARTINGVSFDGSANITVEPYISDDDTGDTNCPIIFSATSTAGFKRLYEDSALYFDNTNNILYSTTFSGALSGNATTATTATNQSGGTVSATNITYSGVITSPSGSSRDKIRIWNNGTYTMGMQDNITFGPIANDYAMTFQMNNANNRGFWWGDEAHTTAQGAMALSTQGWLTVAERIRVGGGQSDTANPAYTLDVVGDANISGTVTSPTFSGNATTATTLQTTRTINGVDFNGSANIQVNPYIYDDDTGDTNCPILFSANSTAGYKAIYEDSALYLDNTNNRLVCTRILIGDYVYHSGDNSWLGFPGNDIITFATANTERARIDSAGDVGIGTNNPVYKLDVNGTVRVSSDIVMNDQIFIRSNGDTDVAIGTGAGQTSQGFNSVAVGAAAGQIDQGTQSVAVGYYAGKTSQGNTAVAIGTAGFNLQGDSAVAIGFYSGLLSQGTQAVALGAAAGQVNQGSNTVALGAAAGQDNQTSFAVAVGNQAGKTSQGFGSIAIGVYSGLSNQGLGAIALGINAGRTSQGSYSVAIGISAGMTSQPAFTTYISTFSIRDANGSEYLHFNNSTGEVSKGNTYSDDRLKYNEKIITGAIKSLFKLRPEEYDKKPSLKPSHSGQVWEHESGLIAQEIFYNAPEFRHIVRVPQTAGDVENYTPPPSEDPNQDPDYSVWGPDPASVKYEQFVPYLIKAVQEIVTELPRSKTTVSNTWGENITGLVVSANTNAHKTNTTPIVALSNVYMDKAWYGVVSTQKTDTNDYDTLVDTKGDTHIWVTDVSGFLECGDLVTTSNVAPGFAQKQGNDLIHSYTVAKVTQDCDFTEPVQRPIRIPKQELSNVTYYVRTTEQDINLDVYEKLQDIHRKVKISPIYFKEVEKSTADSTTKYYHGETEVSKFKYDELPENERSEKFIIEIEPDNYEKLDDEEKVKYTLGTKNRWFVLNFSKSKTPLLEHNEEIVVEELVDVLDENGQIVWEETANMAPVYTLVDYGSYKAALLTAKLV